MFILQFINYKKSRSIAVNEAFVKLFDAGIIYRGKSLVNWSFSLESAISDIEVDSVELTGPTKFNVPGYNRPIVFGQITDIVYRIVDSNDEIIVSTTRPETLLGDVAIAVHPEDERYFKYHDQFAWHPFRKCKIPIIFDDSVDPNFGSGAVKITPAHDKNDFDIAKRHVLSTDISVFNNKGKIVADFEGFGGLPRFDARDKILNVLTGMNLLRETRSHAMVLPICSRSRDVIEFLLRDQWFVDCSELSKNALSFVKNGKLSIYPESKTNEYKRWLSDCRDWCISRQLWWGHQIPAYEVDFGNKTKWIAARSQSELNEKLKSLGSYVSIYRDPDVLDTWFSSSLLPFSAFGWPQKSVELTKYFPLNLMETGHDILFFWVARMIMMSSVLSKTLPFDTILLHGIICDSNGRKMSKSLGNVIVPDQIIHGTSLDSLIDVTQNNFESGFLSKEEFEKSITSQKKSFPNGIPECGVDALRFTLCSSNIQNHFINFDISECHSNKLFFNKVWQATKYLLSSYDKHGIEMLSETNVKNLPKMDQWILSRLSHTILVTESSIDNFNLHLATKALKEFFYYNVCDIYLETTKVAINDLKTSNLARNHCGVLAFCLNHGLQIMSHFTPFLSNALLPRINYVLNNSPNTSIKSFHNTTLEFEIKKVLEISSAIRQLKSQNKITRKMSPKVIVCPENPEIGKLIGEYFATIKTLSLSDHMETIDDWTKFDNKTNFVAKTTAGHFCSIGITADVSLINKSNVNDKKIEKLESELSNLVRRTSNPGYQESASQIIKNKHSEKVRSFITHLQKYFIIK